MNEADANLTTLDCPHCGNSISVELAHGGNAFACPLCGQGFEVDLGAEASAPSAAAQASPSSVPFHQPAKKWSVGAIVLVTLLVCGGGFAVAALVATMWNNGDSRLKEAPVEWLDAQKSGHTIEGVTVRVQGVEVGPVRAKNTNGTVFVSDRQDYWLVRLRIRNGRDKPIEYRTWHAAEFSGVKPSSALMIDDAGKRFVMQQFEDVNDIQGQTLKKTLAPKESIVDVIVFEAPEGLERESLSALRLELPGAACQVEGVFRQLIPKALVE